MPVYADSEFKIFKLSPDASMIFGETYAVAVGIRTSQSEFKGEYYVLSSRPKLTFKKEGFKFSSQGIPEEVLVVDVDFMLQEALQQAEVFLIDRLLEISESAKKPDLMSLPINLTGCPARPFIGLWLRGKFQNEIRSMLASTECESFSKYLTATTAMAPFHSAAI